MSQDQLKQQAAEAALEHIPEGAVLGIGSGSTVEKLIAILKTRKPEACVASSVKTAELLKTQGIEVVDLNDCGQLELYIDGADEINRHLYMIKGGGAALTREKIIAAASKEFLCLADQSKWVETLGKFPLPIEVIPMARSYVARQLVAMGGDPEYRSGVTTDNGNQIIDIHNLDLTDTQQIERDINQIAGVVTSGLFAQRAADKLILATPEGIQIKTAMYE